MRAALILCLLSSAALAAGPKGDGFQIGVYGGGVPTEPLYTRLFAGGWIGLGVGERWRLELSGAYAEGLSQRTELYDFLEGEALLSKDDPLADPLRFTVEGWLKIEPLRGKLALLQSTLGGYRQSFGFGLGGRGQQDQAGATYTSPAGLLSTSLDVHLGDLLLLRLEGRGFAQLRRDESIGLGAEILLGFGVRR